MMNRVKVTKFDELKIPKPDLPMATQCKFVGLASGSTTPIDNALGLV